MTMNQFVKQYTLHDSGLEDIQYTPEINCAEILIDMALWMQMGYKEGEPEEEMVSLVFTGVKTMQYPDDIDYNWVNILDTEVVQGMLKILVLNESTDHVFNIVIDAEDVAVKMLGSE